jgi:phosphoglycerate dehydrogenase-like enzyme
MQPRIVFVTPFPDSATAALEMAPKGFEFVAAAADSPQYREAIQDASYLVGFVAELIQPPLYAAAKNLKLIQLLSAGYDPANIEAARGAAIPIANNGGANSVAVSEHALLLMLGVSRQLVKQHALVSQGQWRGNQTPRLFELRDKTLGIIGLGTIGKKVARLANAFGMRVNYYDVARLTEAEEDVANVRFKLLNELVASADIVSLHVPLNESTHHLIDAAALDLMKTSAYIINTSRGPVIDEPALIEALGNGGIAGAGLDVFDEEPPPANNPLFSLDNVILTAHMAGPTVDSHSARIRNAFDNVQRVERGDTPLWVIPELD